MKTLVSFVLGILLFVCPFAVQAEGIGESPAPEPMLEDSSNYLLSEDLYQGNLSWQGNKAITKFNYENQRKNR